MLGMANLGNHPQGFFGGFFTTGSNVIVLNKIPLQRIKETLPELYKPYVFHVLLHEYIHSLGHLDVAEVKPRVYAITRAALEKGIWPRRWQPMPERSSSIWLTPMYPGSQKMQDWNWCKAFDRSSVSYIA